MIFDTTPQWGVVGNQAEQNHNTFMGVNALILLPADVRISDAAEAIGILAGLKPEKHTLESGGYYCRVPGAEAKGTNMPELATITVKGKLVDGQEQHHTTWHWESDRGNGDRLIYPRSNTFWIAVGIKLVDFFGGSICYNDCGDQTPNYQAKKPRKANNPSDGQPWKLFQDEMLALKPITKDDLEHADKFAAYKTRD